MMIEPHVTANASISDHGQQLIPSKYIFLTFPQPLESQYCQDQQKHAALDFRYRSLIILVLYILLSTGIANFLSGSELERWLWVYGWVGFIIILASVFSYIRYLDRWFSWYVGIGSTLSMALSIAAVSVIDTEKGNVFSYVGIMYAVMIIYAFVGLRFYQVLLVGVLGGMLGVGLIVVLSGHLDWSLLHRTYSGTSLLGLCMAYAIDRRSRQNFLQARALEDAHRQSELQNKQLHALSREDGLTGLSNRRHLDVMLVEEWNRAMRQQLPLAVLMIDVDHFKAYNDHLGHPAGDVCLREVAQAIRSMARRSGDMAARYGGEEFVLLYPATNASHAMGLAHQLLAQIQALRLAHPRSDVADVVTVSIGVAVTTPSTDQQDAGLLLEHADQALYVAKQKGRNTCVLFGHRLHIVPDVDQSLS